jgi:hypothetical protein
MRSSLVWLALLLTILLVGLFAAAAAQQQQQIAEGFTDPKPPQTELDIGRMLQLLQRLGGFVMNPANWQERYALIGKTPVELARLQLAQQARSQ